MWNLGCLENSRKTVVYMNQKLSAFHLTWDHTKDVRNYSLNFIQMPVTIILNVFEMAEQFLRVLSKRQGLNSFFPEMSVVQIRITL